MTGHTYKTTAKALEWRRLLTISTKDGTWQTSLTDAGRYYRQHGSYPAGHWDMSTARRLAAGLRIFPAWSPPPCHATVTTTTSTSRAPFVLRRTDRAGLRRRQHGRRSRVPGQALAPEPATPGRVHRNPRRAGKPGCVADLRGIWPDIPATTGQRTFTTFLSTKLQRSTAVVIIDPQNVRFFSDVYGRKTASYWSYSENEWVGLGGLEPPTSSLSAKRSNRLSYRPVFCGKHVNQSKIPTRTRRGERLPDLHGIDQNGW